MNVKLRRIESLLQREVAEYIQNRIKRKNDNIGFVSVSRVVLSPDLTEAKIYLSFFSGKKEENELTFKILNQYKSRMQSEISRAIHLRRTPRFHFIEDTSIKEGDRVLEIIEKTKKEEI